MSSRIERLRALLEEPLLITNLVNVGYLTGLDSSNAALLVEPERVRLFTDFRYIAAARAIGGVEVVQTKRSLIAWLADELEGRVGFEADVLPWSFAEQLRGGGVDLVPQQGLVEQLRAVKDGGRARSVPARLRDHRPDVRAARERGSVRRTPRARRRLGHPADLLRGGRGRARVRVDRGLGTERCASARACRRPCDRDG